jgi:hypothetical protein
VIGQPLTPPTPVPPKPTPAASTWSANPVTSFFQRPSERLDAILTEHHQNRYEKYTKILETIQDRDSALRAVPQLRALVDRQYDLYLQALDLDFSDKEELEASSKLWKSKPRVLTKEQATAEMNQHVRISRVFLGDAAPLIENAVDEMMRTHGTDGIGLTVHMNAGLRRAGEERASAAKKDVEAHRPRWSAIPNATAGKNDPGASEYDGKHPKQGATYENCPLPPEGFAYVWVEGLDWQESIELLSVKPPLFPKNYGTASCGVWHLSWGSFDSIAGHYPQFEVVAVDANKRKIRLRKKQAQK